VKLYFYYEEGPPTDDEKNSWSDDDELPPGAPPAARAIRLALLKYGYLDVFPRLAATQLELCNLGLGARRFFPACMQSAATFYAIAEEWNAEGIFM
jgi:hypothetical protein